MATDTELLRRYAATHDEAAFGALVQRHLNLVYSVATRHVGGDTHLAKDVTQRVFVDLARKAPALCGRATLGGWLHRATQFTASDYVRADRARRVREQEAELMQELSRDPSATAGWEQLRPTLDAALAELGENDRDAIVLRFFEARPFAEMGATLRVTEDAARMRVERALEKLRRVLARSGVTSTSAALAAALPNQVGIAAPIGFAATVTGAATSGFVASASTAVIMGMTKIQIGIACALVGGFATAYVVQENANDGLRREIAALAPPPQAVAALRAETEHLGSLAAEVQMLRRDDSELKELEQRVAEVKKSNEERARLALARTQDMRQRFYDGIRADDASAQQEIDRMNREGSDLVKEYKNLVATSKDPAVSAENRAEAQAAAAAKLDTIRKKQQDIRAFTENVRKSLSQRVEAFRRTHGDDPNTPLPQFRAGAGRFEVRRVPAEGAAQGTRQTEPGN